MSRSVSPRHRAAPAHRGTSAAPPENARHKASSAGPARSGATSKRHRIRVPIVLTVAAVVCLTASSASGITPTSWHHQPGHLGRALTNEAANAARPWTDASTPHAWGSDASSAGGRRASGHPTGRTPPSKASSSTPKPSSPAGTTSGGVRPPSSPGSPSPAGQPSTGGGSTSGGATGGSSGAATAPPPTVHPTSVNISANIAAVPATDSSCRSAPTGGACINASIAALNHARAVLGLPAYAIPGGFASMSVPQQLLTLSNLDRVLYGLRPVSGVNATLNSAAQVGVTNGGDPSGVDIGSARWTSWASNWAAGYPNAIYAYYGWMYDDGPGSPNIGCSASNPGDCWGHRLNVLHNFGANTQVALGVGYGPDRGSGALAVTQLFEGFPLSASIPY